MEPVQTPNSAAQTASAASFRELPSHAIAVVSVACRYPGATGPGQLWDLLGSGKEGLTRLSAEDLRAGGVPRHVQRRSGFVPVAGIIDGVRSADLAALGLSDVDASMTDPQQLLMAECAAEALDAAGHGQPGSRGVVGVYVGQALPGNLVDNLRDRFHPKGGGDPATSLSIHAANVQDYLPLRLAYLLGVTGPTVSVGATCATSLVAVHLAMNGLQRGECDTALAGGVSLRLPQDQGYFSIPDGPFSPDGHTRSYGVDAAGTVFTQGAGVVVLRRYADAVASGDEILAVLTGSAVGNDGPDRAGFTAPSVPGQARVIAEAQGMAGVTPQDVTLIEGHGTGTAMGDPIEVAALNAVFGQAAEPWCDLGSIKSVIGHSDSAAGVAGLIKAVLAVHHGVVPPTLHAETPNPGLPLAGSALRIASMGHDWTVPHRVAGVSAFGIGGINAHVIVEQAPAAPPQMRETTNDRAPVFLVSAADEQGLQARCLDLGEAAAAVGEVTRRDMAATLAVGARVYPVRLATTDPAAAKVSAASTATSGAVVVGAFAGGGAQFAGMAKGLYEAEPVFAAALDDVAGHLVRSSGDDPRDIALAAPSPRADAAAMDPLTGLPALFAVQVATSELLAHYGLVFDAVLGHSVGEYAAAVAAGEIGLADATLVVSERSRLMATLPDGGMLAVSGEGCDAEELLVRFPQVDLAAVNGPQACVLTGHRADIEQARDALAGSGLDARIVGVNVAAHSRLIDGITGPLRESLARLTGAGRDPVAQYFSAMTADIVTAPGAEHWVQHLRQPVQFHDTLRAAVAGSSVVVQVGPGSNLVALAKALGSQSHAGSQSSAGGQTESNVLATLTSLVGPDDAADPAVAAAHVVDVVGTAWQHGADVDVEALCGHHVRTVRLPDYPWQRTPVGVDSVLPCDFPLSGVVGGGTPGTAVVVQPSAEHPLQVATWHQGAPLAVPVTDVTMALLADSGAAGTSSCGALAQALADQPGVSLVNDPADADVVVVADHTGGSDLTRGLLRWKARYEALKTACEGRSLPVVHVTARAAVVTPAETKDADAVGAAHTGMMRVCGQEVPGLMWVTVDVAHPGRLGDVVAAVVAEARALRVPDAASGHHVAYRGGARWVRQWTPWQPLPTEASGPGKRGQDMGPGEGSERPAPVRRAPRVCVVTGGLGQVARKLARLLHTTHGDHVVLLARTEPAADDPRLAEVADLVDSGAVTIKVADASDGAALGARLADVAAKHGRVDVVVHAAVVIDLVPIAELDDAALAVTLDPKVVGAHHLAHAVATLEHRPAVVVMSSAAGTIGGFGLAAYVAASRYLDTYGPQRGWVTVDWDRWRFGTDAEQQAVSEVTMRNALDAEDALAALVRMIDHAVAGTGPLHVAASPTELNSRSLALDVSRTKQVSGAGDTGECTLVGMQGVVGRIWSDVLGKPVTSPSDDFFGLGGHSLLATRVLAALRDELGVQIALREILTHSTVAQCADLLTERGAAAPDAAGSDGQAAVFGPVVDFNALAVNPLRFDLNRTQHAYWVGRRSTQELGGVGCHFYLEYDSADLDAARYEGAWQRVVDRHPMLRCIINAEGEHVVFDPAPKVVLPRHDLRHLSDADADAKLGDLRRKWSTHVADPATWPLVNPQLVLLPNGHTRVLLSVDVLVCDSGSWFVVDNELRQFYANPDANLPIPGVTFAELAAYLDSQRGGPEHKAAQAYWRARVPELPGAPALSGLAASATAGDTPVGKPEFTRLTATISETAWVAIQSTARESGVSTTAAVLARYAAALGRWSGDHRFSLTLTVYDRPAVHPDVNQVVGEFTAMMLHEVRLPEGTGARAAQTTNIDVSALSVAVQERLYDDLDHVAMSGLEVLNAWNRYHSTSTNIPVVFTSMLGLGDALGSEGYRHDWLGEYVQGVSQTPQVWLDHQAYEHAGQLVLQWDVCHTVLDLGAARAAFADYVASFDDSTVGGEVLSAAGVPGSVAPIGPDTDTVQASGDVATPSSLEAGMWSGDTAQVSPAGSHHNGAAVRADDQADTDCGTETGESDATSAAVSAGSSAPADHADHAEQVAGQLRAMWADLLAIDEASIGDESFLALGGDSLLAVKLAGQVRKQLGVSVPLTAVTADVTIKDLCQVVVDTQSGGGAGGSERTVAPRADVTAPFGLMPLQQAYFVGQSGVWNLSYDSAHVTTDIGLRGVQADGLAQAAQAAADRCAQHQSMLRMELLENGTQRLAVYEEGRTYVPVTVDDFRRSANAEAELKAKREYLAAHGPNPRTGPGVTISITLLPEGAGRLHISSNLMVLDGISIQLFVRHFFTYLDNPGAMEAPFEIDFGAYVETVTTEADPDRDRDQKWWAERIPTLPPPPPVMVGDAGKVGALTPMAMREARLPAATWAKICQQSAAHGATASSVVLAAYAAALAEQTGRVEFTLTTLQQHRQPLHADVDRLLGAFSQTALAPLSLPNNVTTGDVVRAVHTQITDANRHNAVSAIEVTRELARQRGHDHVSASVVFQSTLGLSSAIGEFDYDRVAYLGDLDLNSLHQSLRTPQVALELRAFELNDQLVLSVASVDEALAPGCAQGVLGEVLARLDRLAGDAEWAEPFSVVERVVAPDQSEPVAVHHLASSVALDPAQVATVAALWQDVLGLPEMPTSTDDFFALGGDSLMAIRMINQVRAQVGVEVSPQDFLHDATIATLLGAASEASAAAGTGDQETEHAVVELRSGDEPPIWFLHPSGGDVLCYLELVRMLDTSRALCAITDPGLHVDGVPTDLPGSIDEIVARYRRMIEARQPEGPYLIGGWSMGGTVAHHLACAWEADGVEVSGVFMIDSNSPNRIIALENLDAGVRDHQLKLRYLRSLEAFLEMDLGHHDDPEALQSALEKVGALADAESVDRRFAVFSSHIRALGTHRAAHLRSTPVLLFRADEASPRNSRVGMGVDDATDADLGWTHYVDAGLTVVPVAAHHYSIVRRPAVERIAPTLSVFLSNPRLGAQQTAP